MKARPMSLYFLFILGIIVPIAGCAVLKIDVDVYKGPLSNHDDVQIEQMAAMAMGAKNLLVQLRNELEIEKIEDSCDKSEREKRTKIMAYQKDWIDTSVVATATTTIKGDSFVFDSSTVKVNAATGSSTVTAGASMLISKLALNVNDILSLYKNKNDSSDGRLDKGIEACIEDYLNAKDNNKKDECNILVDELVHFAEKVLILANFNAAFGAGEQWEKWYNKINLGRLSVMNSFGTKINSYVIVLQAIGNSILTQADELQHKASYNKKIKDPGAKNNELWAKKMATSRQPKDVLDTFVKRVKELKDKEVKKQKEYEKEIGIKVAKFKSLGPDDGAFSAFNNLEIDYDKFYDSSSAYAKKKQETYNDKDADSKNYNITNEIINTDEKFHLVLNKLDPGTTTSFKDMREKIVNALAKEHQDEQDTTRKEKLITAKQIMEKEQEFVKEDKDSFTKILSAIKEIVKTRHETKLNDALIEKDRFDKAREISDLADKYKNAKGGEKKYADAESKIKDNIGTVLEKFNLAEERPTPEGVTWQLRLILEDKLKAEQSKVAGKKPEKNDTSEVKEIWVKITQYNNAVEAVKDIPSMGTMVVDNKEAKDTKDVFDQMIALLKHQHIQVVKEAGVDSTIAKNYDDALQLAYSYRSNMVSIRPPSAYLRNSYPSTSLQSDPGLVWENMLAEHAWRNTPFVDWLLESKKFSAIGRAVAEIDKQYWQNINSVRVAGAGRTNYVVAKDDVGNWYVKRYSSNPEDIIKSAQKLALFNLNPMMKTDLVSRLNAKIDQEKVQQPQSEANRSTLEQIFDKYQNEYTEQTKNDYEKLRGILGKTDGSGEKIKSTIESRIEESWGQNSDTKVDNILPKLKEKLVSSAIYLESARKELPEELPEKPEDEKTEEKKARAERIINALREIKRFHTVLISGIRDAELAKPLSDELQNKEKEKSNKANELTSAKEIMSAKGKLLKEAEEKKSGCENTVTTQKGQCEIAKAAYNSYPGDENTDQKKKDYKVKMGEENAKLDTAQAASKKAEEDYGSKKSEFTNAEKNVTDKEGELATAEQAVKTAQKALDSAVRAEKFAIQSTTNIVRNVLMDILEKRTDVVKDYETGIMFIGDAIKENK